MGEWQYRARCSISCADDFFPLGDERDPAVRKQYEKTRTVCAPCPVREQCLQWSIEQGFDYGMFGGKTPRERRKLGSRQHRPVSVESFIRSGLARKPRSA